MGGTITWYMYTESYIMNKYARTPQEIIDLHGLTTREAALCLEKIFHTEGLAHVRIIVGKGGHSKAGPVLRDFVKRELASRNIRFSQSKIHDGGEGALEVFL